MNSFFIKAFSILALPLGELFLLRFSLRSWLELKMGFQGFTDYELFFPAPLGFFSFLWALEQNSGLSWNFSLRKLLLNLGSVGGLVGISIALKVNPSEMLLTAWWLVLGMVILSAMLVCVDVKKLLTHPCRWAIVPALVMVFALVLYFKWGGNFFEKNIENWAAILNGFIRFFSLSNLKAYPFLKTVQLYHPQWAIHIGRGCAGFDALIFFTGAFAIFAPFYWRNYHILHWIGFFLIGLFVFMILNFFRILFLYLVGLVLMRWVPPQQAIAWALSLFHIHAGYLLYGLGIGLYFKFVQSLKTFSLPFSISTKSRTPA